MVDALFDFDGGMLLWFAGAGTTHISEGLSRDYAIALRSANGVSDSDSIRGWLVRDDAVAVPEPGSLSLAGLALMAVAWRGRRRRA